MTGDSSHSKNGRNKTEYWCENHKEWGKHSTERCYLSGYGVDNDAKESTQGQSTRGRGGRGRGRGRGGRSTRGGKRTTQANATWEQS